MASLTIGNDAVFEAMHMPNVTANFRGFVDQQISRYQQIFGGVQNAITDRIHQWQNAYVQTDAARVANAIMRQSEAYFQPEHIRPLYTVADLQNAPANMLRGIMAMPEARKMYTAQTCDGYQGRYYDLHPAATPTEHRDYKLVYDGRIMDSDDKDIDYQMVQYGDDFDFEDAYQYLSVEQKEDIIDTRRLMWTAMAEDRDFTDPMDSDTV